MLSSAMVSVLAPHWNRRSHRTKKGIATEDSEAQGNSQNVMSGPNTRVKSVPMQCFESYTQRSWDRGLRDEFHVQDRTPLVGTRRSTEGWSTMSGPPRLNLNYTTKKPAVQSASLDVGACRLDNRGTARSVSNPVATPSRSMAPIALNVHVNERMSQPCYQEQMSSPSSKPTTSSLLLSLRRIGSSFKNSSLSPALSETNHLSLAGSPKDRLADCSMSYSSPTSPNNNGRDWLKSPPYSSPTRVDETIQNPPMSFPNHGDGVHLSASPSIKHYVDTSCSHIPPTTSRTNPTLSCPQEEKQTSKVSEEAKCSSSDKSTDPSRLSQYEQYAFLQKQALPKGTTLRSNAWWRQVSQEGPHHGLKDTTNIMNNNNNNKNNAGAYSVCQSKPSQSKSEKNGLTARTRPFTSLLSPSSISNSTIDHVSSLTTSPTNENDNKFSFKSEEQSLFADTLTYQSLPQKTVFFPLSSPQTKTSPPVHTQRFSSQSDASLSPSGSSPHALSPISPSSPTYTKPQPLGFERTYPSISKSLHHKMLSTLISSSQARGSTKTNYSYVPTISTTPTTSSSALTTFSVSTTSTSTPVLLTSPTMASATPSVSAASLLTPPVTPTLVRSPSPKTSPSKPDRTFSDRLDFSFTKLQSGPEESGVRQVMWQGSVDPLCVEANEGQTPGPSSQSQGAQTRPLSTFRPPWSVEAPSIFSSLRMGSPTETRSSYCHQTPKITSIESLRGEKSHLSLSAEPAERLSSKGESPQTRTTTSSMEFSGHKEMSLIVPGERKKLSNEGRKGSCPTFTPFSHPPDFACGYNHRYSSPPYSTLMSTRLSQGDEKSSLPLSPHYQQQTSSRNTSPISRPFNLSPGPNRTSPNSKCLQSPMTPNQTLILPSQNRTGSSEGPQLNISKLTEDNSCNLKQSSQHSQNTPLCSSSACVNVIETLVYSIYRVNSTAAPENTSPKPLMLHSANTPLSVVTNSSKQPLSISREVTDNPCHQSHEDSERRSSKEHHFPPFAGNNNCVNEVYKSNISKDVNPQLKCQKKDDFSSLNTLNSNSAIQETQLLPAKAKRLHKASKKMDLVLSKLRQTFSSRFCDDNIELSLKYSPSSQTPSISGSSDNSNLSDITVKSNETLDGDKEKEQVEEKGDTGKERCKDNRYTISPPETQPNRAGNQSSACPGKITVVKDQNNRLLLDSLQKDEGGTFTKERFTGSKAEAPITSPGQTRQQFYKDDRADSKTSQAPCRDISPRPQSWNPHCSPKFSVQCSISPGSSRSPSSPFSSLTPLSPYSPDEGLDCVFFSPKVQHPQECAPQCEHGVAVSSLGPPRSQLSTGTLTGVPCQEKEQPTSYSSCADLKYGIEAGRSISVSSVLSSRRSGSGRISTGSRVLSGSDFADPVFDRGLDEWSVTSGQASKNTCQSMNDYQATGDYRLSSAPSNQDKIRSRSLPRSLTRSLSCWSSEDTQSEPLTTTAPPTDRLWSPTPLRTSHFSWNTEGALTPPPSPPPSPVARRLSKPPSLSPGSPGSPDASKDSQSLRGHLPTSGYVSSLSAFEESSDSSSDTTTDDEYYLETGESEEKETEL